MKRKYEGFSIKRIDVQSGEQFLTGSLVTIESTVEVEEFEEDECVIGSEHFTYSFD